MFESLNNSTHRVNALVVLTTLLVWFPTLRFGFVWDDLPTVVTNPSLRDWGTLWRAWTHDFWGLHEVPARSGYWRPFPTLAYLLTAKLFGLHAWAFHLLNVSLHALATFCVGLGLARWGFSGPALLFGGLFFGLHPIHSETVSFISTLPDLSAAAFGLSGVLLFRASSGSRLRRAFGLLLLAAALLSKESALLFFWIVPFLLPARRRWQAVAAAVTLAYLLVHWRITGGIGARSLWGGRWDTHLGTALTLLPAGVLLTFWPWPTTPTRPFPLSTGLGDPFAWAGLAALGLVSLGAWRYRRTPLGAAGGLFLLFWLPVSNLVPAEGLIADRYLYLPSAAAAILPAALVRRARLRGAGVFLAAAFAVFWAAWALSAARPWRSEEDLWSHAVKVSPTSAVAWDERGRLHLDRGEIEAALRAFARALRLRPDHREARLNLELARFRAGDAAGALSGVEALLERDPKEARAWDLKSAILAALGRPNEAVTAAVEAAKIEAGNWKYPYNAGSTLLEARQYAAARPFLERAARLAPDRSEAWMNLAACLLFLGEFDEAAGVYREVLRRWPGHDKALRSLQRIEDSR